MAKFVAKCDNFGYLGTYWKKGDVLEAEAPPNEHFVPFGYQAAKGGAKKDNLVNKAAAETVKKVVKERRKKD